MPWGVSWRGNLGSPGCCWQRGVPAVPAQLMLGGCRALLTPPSMLPTADKQLLSPETSRSPGSLAGSSRDEFPQNTELWGGCQQGSGELPENSLPPFCDGHQLQPGASASDPQLSEKGHVSAPATGNSCVQTLRTEPARGWHGGGCAGPAAVNWPCRGVLGQRQQAVRPCATLNGRLAPAAHLRAAVEGHSGVEGASGTEGPRCCWHRSPAAGDSP